jgi:hypothetical protein
MKKNWLFIIVQLVFCNCFVQAQFIRAGYYTTNDYYYDFVPDKTIEAELKYNDPQGSGGVVSFDIDNDNNLDCKINVWASSGMGGGIGEGIIYQLNLLTDFVYRLDTSIGCCPQTYYAKVAKELVLGDTISDNCFYKSDNIYLWSTGYPNAHVPMICDWINVGERYIGFRKIIGSYTIYGWIRIEAVIGNCYRFYLTIKDFACNKRLDFGIHELNDEYNTKVYPNIFNEKLIVSTKYKEQAEIVIYNMTSEIVLEKYFSKELIINTTCFSKGFYFYIVRGKNGLLDKGKIIKN